jgi:hypothetical protein
MNQKFFYSFLTLFCLMIGFIFHAYQKEWIVFLLPHQTTEKPEQTELINVSYEPKKITLFFFKNSKWHHEKTSIIWSSDMTENVTTITNNWLTLLEDEKLIDTDTQVISAVIANNKELFLSFNKDFLDKQSATLHKLMIIESLLKTLNDNKVAVQSVRFLIHHQSMVDDHLNFSVSWPITGYLSHT